MKASFRLIAVFCILPVCIVLLTLFNYSVLQEEPASTALAPISKGPIYIAVMDPLALENACACVEGFAQRDYQALAEYLKSKLGVEVKLVFDNSIASAIDNIGELPDIVIGKKSVVEYDAGRGGYDIRHIAMLSDSGGGTTLRGLFVVKADDQSETIADLKGRRIAFGLTDSDEKRSAAIAELKKNGVEMTGEVIECGACSMAVMKILNDEADAAVISDYAMALLVGCQTMEEGELNVIGETDPVPFVAVYTTEKVGGNSRNVILQALLEAVKNNDLLTKLESKSGFIKVKDSGNRKISHVPDTLPSEPKFLWTRDMASQSLGGICATGQYVIVSDKSFDGSQDIWRCLDSRSGDPVWTVQYDAPGDMDYTNAPRASAVIEDGKVYLLGAFGDLHCVELSDGSVVWKCNLIEKFGGQVPTWGFCGTPLIVDEKVIVSTASTEAAVIALDSKTGRIIWTCPGNEPGYGSLIVGTFGGKRQIVGHDAVTIGGWDVGTGKRLWTVKPPYDNDFNVPTPIQIGDRLFVATENNGARLYAFNADGTIRAEPIAANEDFAPDIASPVLINGLIWGACYGGTSCIDPANGLSEIWIADEEPFTDYASFIAGRNHLLIVLLNGMISVVPSRPTEGFSPSTLTVFKTDDDFDPQVWSQPILIGNKLYLRSENQLACLLLS